MDIDEVSGLPIRPCIGCGGSDTDPRHTIAFSDGADQVTVYWHMDCHSIATGCAVCAAQRAGAEELRGEELREHLLSLEPELVIGEANG